MRIALDTNRLTDLFRGDTELAEQLSTCDEVWIPIIVLGEIKAIMRAFLSSSDEPVLLFRTMTYGSPPSCSNITCCWSRETSTLSGYRS